MIIRLTICMANCSNETHESKSDGESRLYRKSNAVPALPSYQGHVPRITGTVWA